MNSPASTATVRPSCGFPDAGCAALRRRGDVVWFDFATCARRPRGQNDYAELAA